MPYKALANFTDLIYLCNKSFAFVLCSLIMHSVDFLAEGPRASSKVYRVHYQENRARKRRIYYIIILCTVKLWIKKNN